MGIVASKPTIDMGVAVAYKEKVVKQLTGGVGQLLKANGVTIFEGTAEMQSPTQVRVTLKDGSVQDLRTSKLILANGSKVARPPFPGIDGRNVIFSDDALTLSSVPSSLVCIGGGVIAVELACMLNAFGTEVTIVEMLPAIIANEDEETRNALARSLTKRGVKIVTGAKVESIEDADGKKRVTATTSDGKATFDGEYVLVAVGRQANPVGLDALVKAGLKMERGCVVANEKHGDESAGRLCRRRSGRANLAGARGGDRGRGRG